MSFISTLVGVADGAPADTQALTGLATVDTGQLVGTLGSIFDSNVASLAADAVTISQPGEYEITVWADFLAPAGPADFECHLHIRNGTPATLRQADALVDTASSDVVSLSCATVVQLNAAAIAGGTLNVFRVGVEGTATGTARNAQILIRRT